MKPIEAAATLSSEVDGDVQIVVHNDDTDFAQVVLFATIDGDTKGPRTFHAPGASDERDDGDVVVPIEDLRAAVNELIA